MPACEYSMPFVDCWQIADWVKFIQIIGVVHDQKPVAAVVILEPGHNRFDDSFRYSAAGNTASFGQLQLFRYSKTTLSKRGCVLCVDVEHCRKLFLV